MERLVGGKRLNSLSGFSIFSLRLNFRRLLSIKDFRRFLKMGSGVNLFESKAPLLRRVIVWR